MSCWRDGCNGQGLGGRPFFNTVARGCGLRLSLSITKVQTLPIHMGLDVRRMGTQVPVPESCQFARLCGVGAGGHTAFVEKGLEPVGACPAFLLSPALVQAVTLRRMNHEQYSLTCLSPIFLLELTAPRVTSSPFCYSV